MQHSTGSTRFAPVAAITLSIAALAFFLSEPASKRGVAIARAGETSTEGTRPKASPNSASTPPGRTARASDESTRPEEARPSPSPAVAAPTPRTLHEHLALVFHRSLDRAELAAADFAGHEDSELERLSIVIRNGGYSATALRDLADELDADDPLRTWAVLATAYGTEFTGRHVAWLEELVLSEPGADSTTGLAALHALRAGASRVDDGAGAMAIESIARAMLDHALSDSARHPPTDELRVALRALRSAVDPALLDRLEQLATNPDRVSAETALEAWRTLAGAGGSQGALAVVAAASGGDANARLAIAEIRDASVAPQLLAWIDEAGRPAGDLDLGGRALAGWLNTGDGEAVDATLVRLAQNGRESELALAGLAHLRDARSRGTARVLQARLEELEEAAGDAALAARARRALAALDLNASRPLPWSPPSGRARVEFVDGLRGALDRVPRDSEAHSRILYDWVRIATPDELDEIEARIAPESPLAASLAQLVRNVR